MTYLTDSGGNTVVVGSNAVTNNSTKTLADAVAAAKYLPTGWLASWAAIRALHASQLVEISIMGDSTTYGAGASTNIGWPYETRRLAVAAGYTNGGQGLCLLYGDNTAWQGYVENLCPWTQRWAGTGTNIFGPGVQGAMNTGTAADTAILQLRGTRIRLYYAKYNTIGEFTYQVDGGSVVTINGFDGAQADTGVIDITGLTEGVHTLTVVNVGSRPQPIPFSNGNLAQDFPGSGALAAGNYQYKTTGINAAGDETLPFTSNVVPVDGAGRSVTMLWANFTGFGNTATGYRTYRSFNGGAFQFLVETVKGGGAYNLTADNGSITPTATAPPTVATFTRDPTANYSGIAVEAIRATGLVFHKDATSGNVFNTYGLDGAAYNNFPHQVPLGLNHVGPLGTAPAARPPWRTPRLALEALGINNQQAGQSSTTLVTNGVTNFITVALAAGALPVVVIPHYSRSASPVNAKPFIDATKSICEAAGVPWLDFNAALDLADFGNTADDPHLGQIGYDAEGAFVWSLLQASAVAPVIAVQSRLYYYSR
jgi:hypothetical protein